MSSQNFKFIVLVFVLTVFSCGFAQDNNQLFALYKQNDFAGLKQALAGLSNNSGTDIQFYKALFNTDAEKAELQYKKVFEVGTPRLKLLAAKKLMDYFYALGYYVSATKYQKYIVEHSQINVAHTQPAKEPVVESIYYIQVGAFGLEENARQQVDFLKIQDIESNVIKREVNGKTLFCVWIEGSSDLQKSLDYANKIRLKYDLQFQIMKK